MKRSIQLIGTAALPISVIGCAGHTKVEPFTVVVRGNATSCRIELRGREITTDELLAIASPEAKPGRQAEIESDMVDAPYRCFGGVIYTLQTAGFTDVTVVERLVPERR